ncbi:MAG: helix-turn-helix domain-containing protein [Verrucomicrobiales bacterium]|nr:helix-turn-helix domain-containing protein [Verrucomicrobiales bacterium]
MKTYEHLTSLERAQIEVLSKEGWGPTRIGRVLGRVKSTISTELRRLGAKCRYGARRAQAEAERLARKARRPVKGTPEMRREFIVKFADGTNGRAEIRVSSPPARPFLDMTAYHVPSGSRHKEHDKSKEIPVIPQR